MSLRPSFSFYLGFRPRHGGSQTRFQSMVLRRISPFHSTLVEHRLPEIAFSHFVFITGFDPVRRP